MQLYMIMDAEKIDLNEEGQALFEFIIFVPIFIVFFWVIINISASINGSINQVKIVRGYFFTTIRNHSFVPNRVDLEAFSRNGSNRIGSYVFGWRMKEQSEASYVGCYKVPAVGNLASIPCDSDQPFNDSGEGETQTAPIKVKTVFGICSASYRLEGNAFQWDPSPMLSDSCTMASN